VSFKDIKGQDAPISFLKRAIENNSVAHAYLFIGIDGIGKGLAANTLAKALNCEKEAQNSCDKCVSCRKIDGKNHPDIFRVICDETQRSIKINSIRALGERICLRPYEARRKVYIIEDAHLMTEEAANALLKTLEEPPVNSIFILTTSNISRLFQTIISRCQVVKFSPLSPEIIENILVKKFGFRRENAQFVSRLADGGINKNTVLQGEDFIIWKNRVIDEFMNGSFFEERSLMFSGSKKELQDAISVLVNWYRDILVYKNGIAENSIINFDRMKEISNLSKSLSCGDIDERLNILIDSHMAVGQNVNPKLVIGALA